MDTVKTDVTFGAANRPQIVVRLAVARGVVSSPFIQIGKYLRDLILQ